MIRVGFKMRVSQPKVTGGGKFLVFSVLNRKKDNSQGDWVTIMTNNSNEFHGLEHKEEVKLLEITGFDTSEYKGKTQLTIYAKVERLSNTITNDIDDEIQDLQSKTKVVIDNQDLPF